MRRRREIGWIGCMVVLAPLLGCAHEYPFAPVSEDPETLSPPADLEGGVVHVHLDAAGAPARSPGSPKLMVKFDGKRWVFSIDAAKGQPARVLMVVDPGERGDVEVYLPARTYEAMEARAASAVPPYRDRASSHWSRSALSLARPPTFRAGRLRSSDF